MSEALDVWTVLLLVWATGVVMGLVASGPE